MVPDLSKNTSIAAFVIRSTKWGKFSNQNAYRPNEPKQIQFVDDVLDLIAIAGLPLCIIEHPVFCRFVRNMNGKIRLISRRTVTRRLKEKSKQVILFGDIYKNINAKEYFETVE